MEEKSEKGCVYFFRHIGLTPVKIGFSTNESPFDRFEQFKTDAPYGSEIIGFIRTENAKELEAVLHQRFSANRLRGEWFEISEQDCNNVIAFYSNIEDIKEKNDFQIAWAKKIADKNTGMDKESEILGDFFTKEFAFFGFDKKIYNSDFQKAIESKFGFKYSIKKAKNMLKIYCKAKKYDYYSSASMGMRYFSLRNNTEI